MWDRLLLFKKKKKVSLTFCDALPSRFFEVPQGPKLRPAPLQIVSLITLRRQKVQVVGVHVDLGQHFQIAWLHPDLSRKIGWLAFTWIQGHSRATLGSIAQFYLDLRIEDQVPNNPSGYQSPPFALLDKHGFVNDLKTCTHFVGCIKIGNFIRHQNICKMQAYFTRHTGTFFNSRNLVNPHSPCNYIYKF